MGGPASSTTAEIYKQVYEETTISMALHHLKVWEQSPDDIYSILRLMHLENFFHYISNLHQNIKFSIEEESASFKSSCQELAFLNILLKHNAKIFVLVHRKPTQTDQYLQYGTHH